MSKVAALSFALAIDAGHGFVVPARTNGQAEVFRLIDKVNIGQLEAHFGAVFNNILKSTLFEISRRHRLKKND